MMSNLIVSNISVFAQALNDGEQVDCNRKGEWYQEGILMRCVRWLFGWEDDRVVRVASAFNRVLDELEKVPVKFNADADVMAKQTECFDLHLKAAEAVKNQLEKFQTPAAKEKLNELMLRISALNYRIAGPKSIDTKDYELMKDLFQNWKNDYDLYADKQISQEEIKKIFQACCYTEFVKLIANDPSLRDLFFKWAIRDNCDVDAFVQFPATSEKLKKAFIGGRIGRFHGLIDVLQKKDIATGECSNLKLNSTQPYEKHYTLPIEIQEGEKLVVKDVSILDKTATVNTNNNYQRTIQQIIASFANRNREAGNFEMLGRRYLENGEYLRPRISNHHSLELGPYNPKTDDYERPDLSPGKKDWWKSIPPLDTLEVGEVEKMYGINKLKQGQWLIVVRSSREDCGRDVDKSHGYKDVLIPDENGRYCLYPFGKYAAEWPVTFLEKALFITNTLPSKVACPDENHYMPQRQQAIVPLSAKKEDGLDLMEMIRKDLIKAREGNIVFQFPWENCAWWVQTLVEKLFGPEKFGGPIPNYYRSHLLEAEPKITPLPLVFRVCRALDGFLRNLVIRIVEFCLCAWRGTTVMEKGKKVYKSVSNSKHRKKFEIYHPSTLHARIMSGTLKNSRITMGNMFLVQASA
jgi:hypothetical protein